MSGPFGRIHNKNCCCAGICIGCCLPVSDDPAPYDVVMVPIPYEIVAPSCAAINGKTGEFTPVDPTAPGIGPCGYCMTYCDLANSFVDMPGLLKYEIGSGCLTSPCGFGYIKLILVCDNDDASDCCGRLRLWVGLSISGSSLVGETAETPPTLCGSNDGFHWLKLSPTTCSCEGGLSAEFDLSGLSIVCDEVWGAGPCAGESRCCEIGCSLVGATVVI